MMLLVTDKPVEPLSICTPAVVLPAMVLPDTLPPLALPVAQTPITSPNQVKASLAGNLQDNPNGTVRDGVTIGQIAPGSAIVTTSLLGSGNPNMGVDIGNTQVFLSGGPLVDPYVSQLNPGPGVGNYKPGPTPAPSFVGMIQTTTFTLSPKDRATMVAFSEITPVPEPGSHALMVAGILALVGLTRARGTKR